MLLLLIPVLAIGQKWAPLDQTKLDKLSSIVEWILGAKFTPAERARFQELTADEWIHTDMPEHQSTLDLLALSDKLHTFSPEAAAQIQSRLRASFVKTLQEHPEAEVSRLLLPVYERGGRGLLSQTSSQPVPATGGALPPRLAGKWENISTSTVGYVNNATGSYAAPSGEGTTWYIYANGQWKSDTLMQSSMYGCTMRVFASESGTVSVNGGTITFDTRGGELDSSDNCNKSFNYKKPLPVRRYVYQWRLERDQYGEKLCLGGANTKTTCYYRK
jgi:hypothetical protein